MINAVIIDQKESEVFKLREQLNSLFPIIKCDEIVYDRKRIIEQIYQSDNEIFFVNPVMILPESSQFIKPIHQTGKAIICINRTNEFADLALSWNCAAYLNKPFETSKIANAIKRARNQIEVNLKRFQQERIITRLLNRNQEQNLLGIPTIKGYEIIDICDIMRCEGLQKCTKIITKQNRNIVSSYSIGMFKSLLVPYDIFFFPHRSHIVNLHCIKSYQKCGVIILKNNESVPISKRHKQEFLDLILHI